MNVLFIAIDDLNDWVGVLNGYKGVVHTPNIDRLAEKGMLFTNAQTPVPICNGSRTAILTGLAPSTTEIWANPGPAFIAGEPNPDRIFSQLMSALPSDAAITLPDYFSQQGYETVNIGKIFHKWNEKPEAFDTYILPTQSGEDKVGSGAIDIPYDGGPGSMKDSKTARLAVDYLNQNHDQPFFLATGFFRPHAPWRVPQDFIDLYPFDDINLPTTVENDLDDVPDLARTWAREDIYEKKKDPQIWKKEIRNYLASISFVDAMVGRVLDGLENSQYADNTTVVLWSDHGQHLGEKRHWYKQTLWEESLRVPLIIKSPGITKAGSVSQEAVSLQDLYPTLIELAGLPKKSGIDGQSLVPLLENPKSTRIEPAVSIWRNSYSVRTEQWRYNQYTDGTEELYNHQSDPNEWVNLADDPQFKSIKTTLATWIPLGEKPVELFSSEQPNFSADSQAGVFIWKKTFDGVYHLRVNGAGNSTEFDINLIATDNVQVNPLLLESNDQLKKGSNGFSLYSAVNIGEDGVDFKLSPGGKALISIERDGSPLPRQVYVGNQQVRLTPSGWIYNTDELPLRPSFESGKDKGLFVGRNASENVVEFRWNGDGRSHEFDSSIFVFDDEDANFSPVSWEGNDTLTSFNTGVNLQGKVGAGWDGINASLTQPTLMGFTYEQDDKFLPFQVNPSEREDIPDYLEPELGSPNAYSLPLATPYGKPNWENSQSGLFLWKDEETWHLRATSKDQSRVFSGSLISDKPAQFVEKVNLENNDVLDISKPSIINFDLRIGDYLDGIDFSFPTGASVRLNLEVGNEQAPAASFLRIGGEQWLVEQVPVDLSGW